MCVEKKLSKVYATKTCSTVINQPIYSDMLIRFCNKISRFIDLPLGWIELIKHSIVCEEQIRLHFKHLHKFGVKDSALLVCFQSIVFF